MNSIITYRVATPDDAKEFSNVLTTTFPLEAGFFALFKHTSEEMTRYFPLEDIKCFLENDLSIVAAAQDKIVGVIGVNPLRKAWYPLLNISVPLDITAVMMEQAMKELNRVLNCAADEIGILGTMAIVQEYWGQGIGSCLVSEAVKRLRSKGFKYAAGLCLNKYSFGLAQKQGFEQIHITRYDEFEYDGRKPLFSSAAEHEGAKLAGKFL